MRRLLSALLVGALTLGVTASASAVLVDEVVPAPLSSYLEELLAGSPADLLPVIVHSKDGSTTQDALDAIEAVGMTNAITWEAIGSAVGIGTPAQVQQVRMQPGVVYVEGNQPYEYTLDTSHVATRADIAINPAVFNDNANNDGTGNRFDGTGTTVAIIDSGVDGIHPFFTLPDGSSKVIRNLENICPTAPTSEPDPTQAMLCLQDEPSNNTDTNGAGGHGTHVSGIAAGVEVTDMSGRNLRGAAPGAKIVMVSAGAGIAVIGAVNGMNWILINHEDPCAGQLNPLMPESGPDCPPIVSTNHSYGAVGGGDFNANSAEVRFQRLLVAEGITVNWAAGNDGGDGTTDNNNPPSKDPTPGILSVANYDDANSGTRDNGLDSSSSRGLKDNLATYPDISAPGANITSACLPTLPICGTGLDTADPFYNTISGTSMATPHIAGYVAVLRQAKPDLTPAEIEDLLEDTAYKFDTGVPYEDDIAARNDDDTTSFDKGHGLVDMAAALGEIFGVEVTGPPPVCPTLGPILTDPAGDANAVLGIGGARSEPSLDVVELDITEDDFNNLTFSLKVTDLPATNTGFGQYYDINFSFGGGSYYVQPSRDATGAESYVLGDFFSDTDGAPASRRTLGQLTGSFNADSDIITIVLPANAIKNSLAAGPLIVDGSVIGGVNVVSRYELVLLVPDADSAVATCPYIVGASIVPATPVLRIGDVQAGEGDSGTSAMTFTVTAEPTSSTPITFDVTTVGVDATIGTDFVDASATGITIPANTATVTFPVTINGDTDVEDDETFTVTLSNPTGADLGDFEATGTIIDDDDATLPTLSVSDATVVESNTGDTATATFAVRLSEASDSDVTVKFATSDGTATVADSDYVAIDPPRTVTINAGFLRADVDVTVTGDDTTEGNETFNVILSDPSGATIFDGEGEGTILDDDAPRISVDDVSVSEDAGPATFTISLDRTSPEAITVEYVTAAGTAGTDDYTVTSGTAMFATGVDEFQVEVQITPDDDFEADEKFELRLSNATNAIIEDNIGEGTITNDDDPPTVSVNSVSVDESDATETATATFTVTLSEAIDQDVTVKVVTSDGTATTANSDYVAINPAQTVTIAALATSQTFDVTVTGDDTVEENETFNVTLSDPTNAAIADGAGVGVGTITNDDVAPGVPTASVNDVTVDESDTAETATATFTVTLSEASDQDVTVKVATSDGTATTADNDYVAIVPAETVTIPATQTSTTFDVTVNGDDTVEETETFTVTLSEPTNAEIAVDGGGTGEGTITNDDVAPGVPTASVNDVTVDESDSTETATATFTVTLSEASDQDVTVKVATTDGTATTADNDYVAIAPAQTVTIPATQTSATFDVTVNGDDTVEPTETFNVTLSEPTNATIDDGTGEGTITNDDTSPTPTTSPSPTTSSSPSPTASESAAPTVAREAGATRAETAVVLAESAFPDGVDTVVLARSDQYADALAGGPLAFSLDAPLLLTSSGSLDPVVAQYLRDAGVTRVVMLGGETALSPQVVADLQALGITVIDRIFGESRFATAAAIGEMLDGSLVYVVEGSDPNPLRGWPDAVSVSGLAARQGHPILLVETERVPEATSGALLAWDPEDLIVVGGEVAVAEATLNALTLAAGVTPQRVAGADRYATSSAVVELAVADGASRRIVWVASGQNYPDALAAGPVVAMSGGVLHLVPQSNLDSQPSAVSFFTTYGGDIDRLEVVGGPVAIDELVITAITSHMR